ncbi:stage VI sporulation protein D [Metabacillus iocasae]|uniref:Stage VI sporulation protein D n=1 Tax=Priestia iocasae TaxID=2291674 RepID=A0ABS2QRF9_9BACI|nr:stage VI sporulation protein D [Metabacillus iocasae]MBM7701341.1 stage VI sporulation protein D [Metabacillus iocasae]
MSQDNLSCLRFSVEESVWFQKGQEVSQLLSISLEPAVSIEEYDQYVSIRGALTLTGEYETSENEDEEQSLREYISGKQVQYVQEREDGLANLSHQFPVDITIPKNRIESIENVFVSIESFDYEIPSPNCLQLMADLSITGLYGEQQSTVRDEEEESEKAAFDESVYEEIEEIEETEEIEAIDEVEIRVQVEEPEEEQTYELEPLYRNAPTLEVEDEVEQEEENQEYFSSFFGGQSRKEPTIQKEEDLYESFEVEVKKEKAEEDGNKVVAFEARNQSVAPSWTETELDEEYAEEANETYSEEPSARENEMIIEIRKDETDNQSGRNENALYLTKLFAKEEEGLSRWKMCIVQAGDSIDQIANRYNISAQSIMRVNHLESEQDITEGQILNIPIGSK